MSFRKKFIRWYYGEFVNDPNGEVIKFGMVRPMSAERWGWAAKYLLKFMK